MAFVVMLHLSLGQTGSARALLQTVTVMTVQQVVATTRIAVDPVYIVAPNRPLSISGEYLALSEVSATPRPAKALGLLAASAFDMPISDIGLPETTGYLLDRHAACRARHASQPGTAFAIPGQDVTKLLRRPTFPPTALCPFLAPSQPCSPLIRS